MILQLVKLWDGTYGKRVLKLHKVDVFKLFIGLPNHKRERCHAELAFATEALC